MKSITKLLLVGAVAVMAMAISVAPSEAKRHKKMAAPAPCMPGLTCSMGGKVMACGPDQKWSPAIWTPVCMEPFCPPKCS